MCDLHLKVTGYTPNDMPSSYNNAAGMLHLPRAGSFSVIIEEYEQELAPLDKELHETAKKRDDATKGMEDESGALQAEGAGYDHFSYDQKIAYNNKAKQFEAKKKAYDKQYEQYRKKIKELNDKRQAVSKKYDGVRWIYQVSGPDTAVTRGDFNKAYNPQKGIAYKQLKDVRFPGVLEGGGFAYMEAFFYEKVDSNNRRTETECHPQGRAPYGLFISAAGIPAIITAEWKDKDGFNITEKVAFGSTVYLHIYTEGLYGQDINILLHDTHRTEADLSLTESDADGDPIERLSANGPDKYFIRRVGIHPYSLKQKPQLVPPDGTITDVLMKHDADPQDGEPEGSLNVQKCVFAVYVDPKWQFEGSNSGFISFDSGEELTIHPVIYRAGIEGDKKDLTDVKLNISKDDATYTQKLLTGNSPVVVKPGELNVTDDGRKRKDFTFGVFIDGTLNNKYNTIARQEWENNQIRKRNAQGDINDTSNHRKVAADRFDKTSKSEAEVSKTGEKRYKYDKESSYENDLSNPAILFQYYTENIEDENHPVFKIYAEGMGTNTMAGTINDKREDMNEAYLKVDDYKKDDAIEGTAFGVGTAGIKDRVKRAIELMVEKIELKPNETIGNLIIDVFGFSRGAASARNFVHDVTLSPYRAKTHLRSSPNAITLAQPYLADYNGNEVDPKYADQDLPRGGHLGYLLTEVKHAGYDNLVVRFAGLYDSVPHHGLFQWNDIADLGLNSIGNAKYTVHLAAGDEHRKNFSLVDISCITGQQGGGSVKKGIELYLPGVHCDVGGSYVEGRPEHKGPLESYAARDRINAEEQWMIDQGWYEKGELDISTDLLETFKTNTEVNGHILSGTRSYVSNQYSFIPLHIMLEFAQNCKLDIDRQKLFTKFDFTMFNGQWKDNRTFMSDIKTRLWDYAFKNAERFNFIEPQIFKQADYITSPEHATLARLAYNERQEAGQADLDREIAAKNENIKKLRHRYLHFNAEYSLIGVNNPNRDEQTNQRKRHIRGAAWE